jgi:hypothetical protein
VTCLRINGRRSLGQRREYSRITSSQQEIQRPYNVLLASLPSATYPCLLCHLPRRSLRRLQPLRVSTLLCDGKINCHQRRRILGFMVILSLPPGGPPFIFGFLLLLFLICGFFGVGMFIDFASSVPVSWWLAALCPPPT